MDQPTAWTGSAARSSATQQFEFLGSGGEYFRVWIVNLLLTIVTLGIFSAWAKVRRLRYFYGNTRLAGSSFEYHGEPLKILKGRLIAVAFVVPCTIAARFSPALAIAILVLFAVALPFIVVNSRRFQARNSSWRNIRFDFVGTYREAAFIYLGLAILSVLTLGLIFPYMMYRRQKFLIGRGKFGVSDIDFGGTTGQFYLSYLIGAVCGAVGAVALTLYGTWLLGPAFVNVFSGRDPSVMFNYPGQFILLWLMWIYLYYFVYAIVLARQINATYGHLRVAGHEIHCEVEISELGSIYLGNLLFMTLTLGLYAPWAKVRLARYRIECLQVKLHGSLDNFVAAESRQISATGSELGDLLDLDFGL
jgi:uncharacterized membrane protein YjgN (DUF898 family)